MQDHDSGAPSIASGGIVLRDATDFGGGEVAANVVRFDAARRKLPFDIDAGGAVGTDTIEHSVCQRGNPPEVCPESTP